MARVIFYEKPGCMNNSKQKKMLLLAGHQLDCRNLLKEKWDKEQLLKYFSSMPIASWFNPSAPDIKSGKVKPETLSEEQAIELMIHKPILIRRPLICVHIGLRAEYRVGFKIQDIDHWIGLAKIPHHDDLETCPQQTGKRCD